MVRQSRLPIAVLLFILMAMTMWVMGCAEDDDTSPTSPDDATFHQDSEADCAGCHTSKAMLQATMDEDDAAPPASSGEG